MMSAVTPQPPLDPYQLPPPDVYDPVIEACKKDVDRTLLRENLRLSVEERFRRFENFTALADSPFPPVQ